MLLFPAVRIPVETGAARRWRRQGKKTQDQENRAVKPTRYPFVWCVASLLACQNDELATIISPRLASPRLARNVKCGGALPGDCWRRQKGARGRFEVCSDSDRRQRQRQRLCGCFIPGGERSLDGRFQDTTGKRTSV